MLLIFFFLFSLALAICPGYDLGIGSKQSFSDTNTWMIYGSNCSRHQAIILNYLDSPCTTPELNCFVIPPPYGGYTDTVNDLTPIVGYNDTTIAGDGRKYTCYPNPNVESCPSSIVERCCRLNFNTTLPPLSGSASSVTRCTSAVSSMTTTLKTPSTSRYASVSLSSLSSLSPLSSSSSSLQYLRQEDGYSI